MSTPRPAPRSNRNGSPGLLLPLFLGGLVITSAVAVVQVKHDNRRLTNESNQLREKRDQLGEEYSQLKIEEAAHSSHARIETLARDQLKMVEPRETVMVRAGASGTTTLGRSPMEAPPASAGVTP